MSVRYRCDKVDCGLQLDGRWDGFKWVPPLGWHSWDLDDDQLHGCTQEHLDCVLMSFTIDDKTPSSGGIPLPTKSGRFRRSDYQPVDPSAETRHDG